MPYVGPSTASSMVDVAGVHVLVEVRRAQHGRHEPPVDGAERLADLGGLVDHATTGAGPVDLLDPQDVGVEQTARPPASRATSTSPSAGLCPCSRLNVARRTPANLGAVPCG